MENNTYIYLALMVLVTFAIRVLPLTLIRKQIKNRFLQSFLYYVPYVTLAVMTFPAILFSNLSLLGIVGKEDLLWLKGLVRKK